MRFSFFLFTAFILNSTSATKVFDLAPSRIDMVLESEEKMFWERYLQNSLTTSPTKAPIEFFSTDAPVITVALTVEPSAAPTTINSPSDSPTKPSIEFFSTDAPTITVETESPTESPTVSPTESPTKSPTKSPTESPTKSPTESPTKSPTITPTKSPTMFPTTSFPSRSPSDIASNSPSISMPPSMRCNIDPITRRSQILDVLDDVSDSTLLRTVGTPQSSAAEWLVEEDEFYVCPDDEKLIQRYVMALFYFSTEGDSWTTCSRSDTNCTSGRFYLAPSTECEWFGLTCDTDSCITEIDIASNNLVGTLPFEFEQLTELEVLSLEKGSLLQTIPSNLGELNNLRILDLDFNNITGKIPEEIYNILALQQLDLNSNKITGTISTQVGNLANLRLLQLYENSMTGTIPTELGQLESLVIGEFFNNTFTGFMPDEVCANRAPNGDITGLTADCFPNPEAQLVCNCCTGCAVF